MSEITKDTIVTVTMEDSYLNGQQGQVIEVVEDGDTDGPIGVQFHPSQMSRYTSSPEDCVVRFHPSELRIDGHWTVTSRALRLFPRSHHSISSLRFAFSLENPCMHEGCGCFACSRIVVNIGGDVIELDVCQMHSNWDGRCADIFPTKRNYQLATPIVKTS